jgi:hypothetical protein
MKIKQCVTDMTGVTVHDRLCDSQVGGLDSYKKGKNTTFFFLLGFQPAFGRS